jgi:hypothetical protein
MCVKLSEQSLKASLRETQPNVTVEKRRKIPSDRLQRIYEIKGSGGCTLGLVLSTPPMLRLLRSEQWMANSEITVVRWLHDRDDQSHTDDRQVPRQPDDQSRLSRFLPALISRSPTSQEAGTPFSLFRDSRGSPITVLPKKLTPRQRKDVDFQLGALTREVSQSISPTGQFGTAAAVLAPGPPLQRNRHRDSASYPPSGSASWSTTFHSMLEGILRDAEDMAVRIPYTLIRGHFKRLGHLLDAVTIPRLVIIDAVDDSNVLVAITKEEPPFVRKRKRQPYPQPGADPADSPRERKRSSDTTSSSESQTEKSGTDDADKSSKLEYDADVSSVSEYDAAENSPDAQKLHIQVTGLRDWSNCVFGDLLFARVFSDEPSAEFLQGLYGAKVKMTNPWAVEVDAETQDIVDELMQDHESYRARLLLYQAYHAAVAIVREFYRPRRESSVRELAARKRLVEVLAHLDKIRDDVAAEEPPSTEKNNEVSKDPA